MRRAIVIVDVEDGILDDFLIDSIKAALYSSHDLCTTNVKVRII